MSICPRCQAPFHCGVADGTVDEPCWCMKLPPLPKPADAAAAPADQCLCPDCLRQLVSTQAHDGRPGR